MVCSIIGSCLIRIIWFNTAVRFYHEFYMIYVVYYIGWMLVLTIESIYISKLIKKLQNAEHTAENTTKSPLN